MTALLLTSHSPQDTARYAEIVAAELRPRDVLLLAGDLGCLMNMAGKLAREGSKIEVRHVVEVLAGMTQAAPICAANPEK